MAKANQHVKKVTERLLNASEQIDDLKSVGGSDGLFKAITTMGEKNLDYMDRIKSIELKLSIVDIIYKIGLRSNLKVATIKPPKTPIMFPTNTRNGTAIIDAKSRVDIRNCIGLVDKVSKASIWLETLIVAISAAIFAPTLPHTINPARTGPNSLRIDVRTIFDIVLSSLKLSNPEKVCKASTMPEKKVVKPTTGKE